MILIQKDKIPYKLILFILMLVSVTSHKQGILLTIVQSLLGMSGLLMIIHPRLVYKHIEKKETMDDHDRGFYIFLGFMYLFISILGFMTQKLY